MTTEITQELRAAADIRPIVPRPSEPRYVSFGPIQVDLQKEVVRKDGSPITLSGKPYCILLALLERPGEIVTRESLYQRLWPIETGIDRHANLNTTVNKLRRSLGDSSLQPLYIETIPRRGYMFIADPQISDRVPAKPGFRLVAYIVALILIGSLIGAGIWMAAWISYQHHALP